jgi:uncharacterized protein (UPF0548 family)
LFSAYFSEFSLRQVDCGNVISDSLVSSNLPLEEVYSADTVDGYHVKIIRGIVGKGRQTYENLSRKILSCQFASLPWVSIVTNVHEGGDLTITHARLIPFPLWTILPCRVTNKVKDIENKEEGAVESSLYFRTVNGHLMCGEERYRVIYKKDEKDAVILEIISCSKINSFFGYLLLPLVRKLQMMFFQESLRWFQTQYK